MSVRIIRKSTAVLTNDHNNLLNRGASDQHTINAITGLAEALAEKYVKPADGIPKKDLGFDVATLEDVNAIKADLADDIDAVNTKVIFLDERVATLEDIIYNQFPELGGHVTIPNLLELNIEHTLHEEFIAEQGDREFFLTTSFTPGNRSLKVFKNGDLQSIQNGDYIEVSENQIQFVNPLDAGDYIVMYSVTPSAINSPIHEEYEFTGNTTFNLAYRYNIGDNSLSVYLNGSRLNVNRDYTEVNERTVILDEKNLTLGDIIVFRRETHIVGNVVHIEDGSNFIQTTWTEEVINQVEGNRIIRFDKIFVPGTSTLQVLSDGLVMEAGDHNDYVELDEHTIRFNYDLEFGEVIRGVCVAGLYQWIQSYTSKPEQKVFITDNKYVPGHNDILVYENGLLLNCGDDYTEVNYSTVQLSEVPPLGSTIKIYRRR